MSIPHGAPQIKGNAAVIDIQTRQAIVTTTAQRGGRRDPLPKFDITIPKYDAHNPPIQSGKKRQWVKFERGMAHDPKIAACNLEAIGVFVLLVAGSKEGQLEQVTVKDVAVICHKSDLRQIRRALRTLSEQGLILVDGEMEKTGEKLAGPKPPQSHPKATPKPPQSQVKTNCFEELGYKPDTPPLEEREEKKEKREKAREGVRSISDLLPPPELSPSMALEEFQKFKAVYPKKWSGRMPEACAVWIEVVKDRETVTKIIDSVKIWKESEDWTKEGGRYIPLPANFLSKREWMRSPNAKGTFDDIPDDMKQILREGLGGGW